MNETLLAACVDAAVRVCIEYATRKNDPAWLGEDRVADYATELLHAIAAKLPEPAQRRAREAPRDRTLLDDILRAESQAKRPVKEPRRSWFSQVLRP